MAKKEKEEIKEEIKEELETVEMTKAQKEKVIKFMAEEAEKAAVVEEEVSLYDITLNYGHKINGTSYGPGKVQVKAQLTSILMSQDAKQRENEIAMNVSADRMYKIMNSGQAVRVK